MSDELADEFKQLRLQVNKLRRQNRQARLARVEKLHPGTIVTRNGVRKFKSRIANGLKQEHNLSKTYSKRSHRARQKKSPPTDSDIIRMKKLLRRENGRANKESLYRDGSPDVTVDSDTGALKSTSRVAHGEAMAGFLPIQSQKTGSTKKRRSSRKKKNGSKNGGRQKTASKKSKKKSSKNKQSRSWK